MRFNNEDDEPLPIPMKNDYLAEIRGKFGEKTDMLINLALVCQATLENMAVIFDLEDNEKLAILGIIKYMVVENHVNKAIDEIDDLLG